MGTFIAQQSFNGGEIAPQFYDRTDLELYLSSVRKLENWFPLPAGGIDTRPFLHTVTPYGDFTPQFDIAPFVDPGFQTITLTPALFVREVNGGTIWVYFAWQQKIADPSFRRLRMSHGTLERWNNETHGAAYQCKKDGQQTLLELDRDTTIHAANVDEALTRHVSIATVGPAMFVSSQFFSPFRVFATGEPVVSVFEIMQFYQELIGTVAVTSSSAAVVGTDTLFVAQLSVGDIVTIQGRSHTIASITDATHLTLTAVYTGLTISAVRMDSAITTDVAFGVGEFPRLTTFFRSRLLFFSTFSKPTGMWASRPNDPFTIIPGGAHDDAPIQVELLAPGLDSFLWALSFTQLVLGGSRGEYTINAPEPGPLTPTNFSIAKVSSEGGSPVEPVLLRTGVIFSSRSGTRLFYSHFDFARQGFVTQDLGIFAPHLLTERIDSLSYRPPIKGDPAHRIFVLLKTQVLKILEFDENYGIQAWHQFTWDAGDMPAINHITSLTSAANTQFMSMVKGDYATIGYFCEDRETFFSQPEWPADAPRGLTYDLIEQLPTLNTNQVTTNELLKGHPRVAVFSTYEGPIGTTSVDAAGNFTIPNPVLLGAYYIGVAYGAECVLLPPVVASPQGPLVSRIRRKIRLRLHYYNTEQLTINGIPELGGVPAAVLNSSKKGILEQRQLGWITNVDDDDRITAPGTYAASVISLTREVGF